MEQLYTNSNHTKLLREFSWSFSKALEYHKPQEISEKLKILIICQTVPDCEYKIILKTGCSLFSWMTQPYKLI